MLTSWFNGRPWYDWCYVDYVIIGEDSDEETKQYPSLTLGFVQIGDEDIMAVVRTSADDFPWEKRLNEFVSSFQIDLETDDDYALVPLSSIVHPLFVFQDYDGDPSKFYCSLPKRNWSQYFNSRINESDEELEEEEENDEEDEQLVTDNEEEEDEGDEIYVEDDGEEDKDDDDRSNTSNGSETGDSDEDKSNADSNNEC